MKAKGILTITSLAAALVLGGGALLYLNMGSIAKQLAEDYASRALGVKVEIGGLDISVQESKVGISNLKVANPDGYKKPYVLTVQHVNIVAGNLGRELLEFRDVSVEGADVYLEINVGGTNLGDIRKKLNPAVGAPQSEGEKALKVILDKLLMNGKVHTSIIFLDKEIEPFVLPPVTVSGIGRENGGNGALAGEAVAVIWNELSKTVMSAANQKGYLAGLSPEILRDAGMGHLDIMKDKFEHDTRKIKEGLKSLFE